MKRLILIALPLALLLSACAQATPTVDAAQVQASAIAAANTMIAQTQAAMPTATPIPPTPVPSPTPLPSPTLGTLPTLQVLASPTTASTGDDCNHPLDAASSGPAAPVLIRNNTKGPATVGLYIGRKNLFGQCGYLSWSVPKMNSILVSVPYARLNQGEACYWASAYVNDPNHPSTPTGGPFCLANDDKWTMDVGYDSIRLTPP